VPEGRGVVANGNRKEVHNSYEIRARGVGGKRRRRLETRGGFPFMIFYITPSTKACVLLREHAPFLFGDRWHATHH